MGTKYVPSIKDLRANERYQKKQNPHPIAKKPSGNRTVKKAKRC